MRNKLEQKTIQSSHLSPQQIKAIKLLSFSEIELLSEIDNAIEDNPALEKTSENPDENKSSENDLQDISIKSQYSLPKESTNYIFYENSAHQSSLYETLLSQLPTTKLEGDNQEIAHHLIASLTDDGFLSVSKEIILSDLKTDYNIECSEANLNEIIEKIKNLEPIGCGSESIEEFLLLQLNSINENKSIKELCIKILFVTLKTKFSNNNLRINLKKYLKNMDKKMMNYAYKLISTLKTRPFDKKPQSGNSFRYFADFIVHNSDGNIIASLHSVRQPSLIVSSTYKKLLANRAKSQNAETLTYIKSNIDKATFFIDAIKKRRETLTKIVNALADKQKEFFLSYGDPTKLKPMIITDIAEAIDMHPSTVSRAITNRYIRTDFGIISAKHLFSKSIATDKGQDASSREIVSIIKSYIDAEKTENPYSDLQITKFLNDNGYKVARRTVAKYREQLGIPASSLRKR